MSQAFENWKKASFLPENLPDFDIYFKKLIGLLQKDEPFSMVRICDGEIYVMAFNKSVDGSVSQPHLDHLSKNLQSLVDLTSERDNLIVGLQENTIWNEKMHITEYTNHLSTQIKNKVPASLISWSTVSGKFDDIVDAINKSSRPLIVVGPEHIRFIKIFKKTAINIMVQEKSCWVNEGITQAQIVAQMSHVKNPIILYSCSIMAKNLILKNYLLFGDNVIQLDLGSNLDPYCNVSSRPWHNAMINPRPW